MGVLVENNFNDGKLALCELRYKRIMMTSTDLSRPVYGEPTPPDRQSGRVGCVVSVK